MEQELSTGELIGTVLVSVAAFQAFLYGVARALEKFKDRTTTTVDNKAHAVVTGILYFIDIVTGNREHKEHVNVSKTQ